ncbi:MAG: molybdenum ABC transporter ATP-binding protein [Reyranellaceae bacterium]
MIVIGARLQRGDFALDIDVELPGSGVSALFGASGAGKSTVIDIVAGLATPRAGRIVVNDVVYFDSAAGIDLPPERRRVGYVFQDARLFPHVDVAANLHFGEKRRAAADRIASFDEVVDLLGIGHLLQRRPATLSGGEKQRVAIGRALLSAPRLLLLDEPLASLDAPRKAEILPYLQRLRARFALPMLYVSHAWDEVALLADHVVRLEAGQVTAQGAPQAA